MSTSNELVKNPVTRFCILVFTWSGKYRDSILYYLVFTWCMMLKYMLDAEHDFIVLRMYNCRKKNANIERVIVYVSKSMSNRFFILGALPVVTFQTKTKIKVSQVFVAVASGNNVRIISTTQHFCTFSKSMSIRFFPFGGRYL